MRGKVILALVLPSLLIPGRAARADEIHLKDGAKITGTIVGFENDSFLVETSYGFALIQKDKVTDIHVTAAKKESDPKSKSTASEPSPSPAAAPADAQDPASSSKDISKTISSAARALAPMRAPVNPGAAPGAAAKTGLSAPTIKNVVIAAPAAPATPPLPPAPEPLVIRDEIRGNQYVNLTYNFQMYKPPSWELIPAARKALPDAVAALGTHDQTTLMVIGRAPAKNSLDAHAASTEKALQDVYENYREISNRRVTVAGFPAVEQHARGAAGGHDWSVTVLTLFKDADAYTILGMTWADSDLIQVQENVIAKTVNSLMFTAK